MTESPADGPRPTTHPALGPLSRGDLQQRAIKGAYWTLLHTAAGMPVAFGVNILLARILGPADYGRLAYLTTIMLVAGNIISLGIGTGTVQFGTKAHALGRQGDVKTLLSSAQAFHIYLFAPVLTLVVMLIADVSPFFLIIAVVFGILLPSVLGSAPYCFGIENKTAQGAQNAMIVNLLTQAAVVIAILTARTADAVWVTRLIVGGLALGLTLFYVAPAYRRAVLRPRFRAMPRGFWRFSLPAGAAEAVGTIVSSRIEVVVLTWMAAGHAAGIFALAFGLAAHLFGPAQALVGPLIPAVSGLHEVDHDSVGRALARTLRASATALALLMSTALPLFAFLLPVIYGQEFAQAANVLVALGVAAAMLVIASPIKAFIMARLSGTRLLVVNVAALVVDVGLMIALVPALGVWGAVIGNAGAAVTQISYVLIGESRAFGLSASRVLRSIAPFVLGLISCAIAWGAIGAIGWPPILSAIASALLGGGLLFAGLLLARTGLSTSDVAAISSALPSALRRPGRVALLLCAHAREGKPGRS